MLSIVERAERFAKFYHRDQTYDEFGYDFHLNMVFTNTINYADNIEPENDNIVQAAAWLHDILEDTDCSPDLLRKEFGETIFEIVFALTDPKGGNCAERKAAVYKKLQPQRLAVYVKLCDRLANVTHGFNTFNREKIDMYIKEHKAFRDALYIEGEYDSLWAAIERILDFVSRLKDIKK